MNLPPYSKLIYAAISLLIAEAPLKYTSFILKYLSLCTTLEVIYGSVIGCNNTSILFTNLQSRLVGKHMGQCSTKSNYLTMPDQ